MIRKRCWPVVLAVLLSAVLYAQEKAEIVYAEGEGFTLVRAGESVFYDLYAEPAEGMVLLPGDMVLTEQGTWMEIEINKTGSLIKIAENTTFSIDSLENQGGVFGVSYGRIRAKVQKLTDDSPFWIQGADTVAGVRGTDFGYDLFYDRESPASTRTDVYCFEGKVEVVKTAAAETGGEVSDTVLPQESVILGRNEMVSVFSESEKTLKKERVSAELEDFWEANDFQYDPIARETGDNGEGQGSEVFKNFYNDEKRLKQAALYSTIVGSVISGIGVGTYLWADGSAGTAIGLSGVGGVLVANGGFLFIRALVLSK